MNRFTYENNDTKRSIVDYFSDELSLYNQEKTLRAVFYGYLYNRKELAEEVNAPDAKEWSDQAIMLHLYERYGKDCLLRAKGMFSFAVQNMADGSLFLARDRAGGKPLYYCAEKNHFLFGPDLKGFLKESAVERKINKTALAQYLMLSYIPAPLTILENIYKLPAAHYMTVSATGEVSVEEYWDVVYDESRMITDYEECKKQLRETVFKAVEESVYAEPSVGILLSGGIDSNIVTGVMSQLSGKAVDTFSIGYNGVKDYDESDRVKISAKFHNSNHNLFYIEFKNIIDNIEKIIDSIDEPYADSSYLPTYTISQIAGGHVKTVLTGDAGDELFAGYDKYLIGYYGDLYNKIPAGIRTGVIEPLVGKLPAKRTITRKLTKVIENSQKDVFEQRRNTMCLGVSYDNVRRLVRVGSENALDFIRQTYDRYGDTACEINRTLYTDYKIVLEGDMLPKAERASRLAGITSKAPLLHPDVVELAARIPVEFKIKGKDRKIILKDTFSDCLPKEAVRGRKIGFGVPVSYWFQNELRQDLLNMLNPEKLEEQGLLNSGYVNQIVEEHLTGKKNYGGLLWALYIFEKWYHKYFEA